MSDSMTKDVVLEEKSEREWEARPEVWTVLLMRNKGGGIPRVREASGPAPSIREAIDQAEKSWPGSRAIKVERAGKLGWS